MGDIVNLRQFRKQKGRGEKEQAAEQNRALHGRSKIEKTTQRDGAARAETFLEGHRRQPAGEPDGQ